MKRLTIASTLALGLALLGALNSNAGTVTPATGGTAISAGTVGGAWTALTGPVYTESAGGEVGTGTIILNVPAGFIFDTACCPLPTMMISGDPSSTKNINNSVNGGITPLTITSTQLTFTVSSKSTVPNTLTWQNIRVRPTATSPLASGNITKSGSSSMPGVTDGVTNFGTLTEIAGVPTKMFVTLPNQTFTSGSGNSGAVATQTVATAFNISKLTAVDDATNIVVSYTGTKTISYSGPSGSPIYTTSVNFSSGQSTTALATTLNTAETTTITATDGTLTGVPSSSLTVVKKTLTVSGVTANNKVYDGTTNVTLNTGSAVLVGVASGDTVTLNTGSAAGAFATKTVGAGKTVTVSGLTISGANAGNYTLTQPTTTADITAAAVTGSITAGNKVYEGTTTATIATRTLSGVIGTDVVSLTGGAATFANKNVGTGKTVTATGLTLSGADAGNYQLTSTSAGTTADITARTLTVSATGVNKVYDGTTTATVTLSDNRVAGDVLTTGYTNSTFADKNVGTGKTVSVSGITVTGTDSGNYTFNTTASTTANITVATVTGNITANSKAYDGTTTATIATRTLSGVIGSDVVSLTGGTATFANKNVGTGKTVTATSLGLTGADAGSYQLASTSASTTADITARTLTVNATGVNKAYDGTTAATVTLSDDRVAGDVLTIGYTSATFADKNVGAGKTVSVAGITVTSTDAGNYTFNVSASTTANITTKTLTVSAMGVNKVYDSTTTATVTLSDNRVAGDALTTGYTSATFADKNVGTGKTISVSGITVTGTDSGNYTFNATASTTANITVATVTGSITANSKVYDGTNIATIATRTLSGVIGSDVVSLTGGTAAFANKNVGAGKTVTATGLSLSGADAANYTVNTSATATADITARTLTVSATGVNKAYDGTATATVTLADNRVAGDVLTTGYTSAAFPDANVGTGKSVSVSGITVTGIDSGNYSFNTTASTTANITQGTLTVTADNLSRLYGAANPTFTATYAGFLGSDDASVVSGSPSFSTTATTNSAVGAYTVTVTQGTLGAANYTFSFVSGQLTVTKATVTASITASNRVYDATTAATIATRTLSGALLGDDVSLSGGTATFADKNIGTGKTVTATGLGLTGTKAGNYQLASTNATTTANITAKGLTVTGVTANNKVYDGTTTATLNTGTAALVGVVGGDNVTLNTAGATGSFASKSVGTGKAVTIGGLSLSGTDAGNYTLTQPGTTANITAKALTVTATGIDKVYDATTAATVTLSDNRVAGDILTTSNTNATFASASVGTAKTITVSGISISGTDAGNYTVNTTASTTANITAKALTVTGITANNKVYDGTTAGTLNTASATLVGKASGDTVTLSTASATGAFADKNIGTGKAVSVSGLTISGTSAGNYTLTQPTTTANITAKGLTVSGVTANNKVYDATTAATLSTASAALVGVVGGDAVTLNAASVSGTFADPNIGSGKTVTVNGLTIGGTDASNYGLTQPTTTANITAKNLTVSGIAANNKVYDGTTAATLNTGSAALVGVVSGDAVTLSVAGATGVFANKNIGTAKTVTISGLTISGTSASNYTLTQPATAADITGRALTVSATGVNKGYDGTTTATLTLSDNRVAGDVLTTAYTSAAFADENAGTGKSVSVNGITVTGTDAGNYTFNTTASATANITARAITVTAVTDTKMYDGTTSSAQTPTITAGSLASGDTANFSQAFSTATVGTGKTLVPSGSVNDGNSGNNYTVTFANNITGVISAKALTVSGITANTKAYDGTTTATLNTAGAALVGVASGDTVTLNAASATGAFANKTVGTAKTVTISGLSLSGANAGSYTLTQPTATADITARAITVTAATNTKAYDGTTSAAAVPTITTGSLASGDTANFSETYDTKSAGTGKTLTPTGSVTDGNSGNNYAVTLANTTTGVINAKALTVSGITANNKVYDGTTATTLNTASAALVGVVGGDSVTLGTAGATGAFATKTVGTGKTVTVSGLTLGGTDAGNYTLTQPGTTANITAKALTVTATGIDKVYDATTAATVTLSDNRVAGDVLTTSNTSAIFASATVGTAKTVSVSGISISGTDAGNYTVNTTASTTANITAKALTVTGITANNKAYDGTTTAALNTGSAVLAGAISGDHVSLSTGSATGAFADNNVGTGKTVTISGLTLSGTDAGNYTLTQPSTTANITARSLTVSATGVNKVYDGTTTTTVTLSDNRLAGDVLTTSYTSAAFATKTVGTAKTVTVSGIAISGADAGNYTFNTTASTTANITGVTLTGNITANSKVYDGTTAATIATRSLSGVIGADAVSLTGGTATFADKNVGTAKTVTATGLSLTGADAGNYTVNTTASTTAAITVATVTGSVTANNKIYDGTTAATIATRTLSGVLGSDVVSLSGGTAGFDTPLVAAGKTVTVTGLSLGGTDAGNYQLASTTATTTASITAKGLTVTGVTINNKVYDATTAATLNTAGAALVGVSGSDNVTLNTGGAAGAFADKTVGTGKTVSVSGLTLGGADAGNYTLTPPTPTANITAASVTVTGITAGNKVYDRTTTVTLGGTAALAGVLGGDAVTLGGTPTASFADKVVANNKPVTVTGYTLSGADAGNYALTQPAGLTANITAKSLTVSGLTANNKAYDGTTAATLNTAGASLVSVISGDTVTLGTAGAAGVFTDKTVGNAKTVNVSGLTLGGADAANYSLTQPTTTANITVASVTVSGITANNKVYDALTAATLNTAGAVLVGAVSGDSVTLNAAGATGAFASKTVGTGKTVTVTGLSLSGTDVSNYLLIQPTTTATITAATVTGSLTASNKVYDATTVATIATRSLSGVLGTDVVSLSGGTATFADKNIGTGKTVTATGLGLAGTDAANYQLASTTATSTASITAKGLTVTGVTANNKVYDGVTSATLATGTAALVGVVSGDSVTLNTAGATGVFADKNVGTGKTVTVSGLTLGGTDAGNYTLSQPAAAANITVRSLTVTATGLDKVYDATTAATVTLSDNRVAGDVLTTSNTSAIFASATVGTAKTVTVSGIAISGADAGNYTVNTSTTTTANITAKALTVTGVTANNKAYDGTTTATLNTGSAVLAGAISGDHVSLSTGSATGTFVDNNVGTAKTVTISGLTLSGTDAGNYTLTQPSTTANITARALTVSATGVNKVYDGTTATTVTLSDNRLAGDVLTTSYTSAAFATKTVGSAKTVNVSGIAISGADAGNYTFNTTASTTANITGVTLTGNITATSKVYDGTTAATIATRSLSGVIGTDVVSLTGGTATFTNKNVGTAKTVTATGLSLSGPDAANYTVNTTAITTADITTRALTVSATGVNKAYDGTTAATVTLSDNRVAGDVLTTAYTSAAFADDNVGTAKAVSVTGITLTGTDSGNYTFNTTASATANITARTITVTAVTDTKVYDGTTSSTPTPTITAGSLVSGDTANFTQAFSTATVGTAKTLIPSGSVNDGNSGNNYSVTLANNTTGVITAKGLTVSGITANNKVYDATTVATLNTAGATLVGVVSGDTVTLNTVGATGTFANKNVGTAKTVTISGLTLSGASASNYTVTQPTATADITARTLTVSATGVNKVYDGTTTTTVTLADNRVAGDVLTTSYTSAAFADKTIGIGKTVNVSAIAVTGTDAGNYTFNTTASTTANITAKGLTVTGVIANTKVYDGTTTATLNTGSAVLSGVAGGDTVTLDTTVASGAFASKTVGTGKAVTISGIAIAGADAGNYTLTQPAGTANITARPLTVSATGVNKVYDGTTATTVTLSDNRVAGDLLTTAYTSAVFADKNVGTGKAVNVSGITMTGTDSSNYSFNTTTSTTANITAKTLTISATGVSKVYDGTATAAVTLADNRVAGDVLTTSYTTAAFTDKTIGIGKTVNVSGITMTGTDSGNYSFNTTASTTASITAKNLTISGLTANNKVYDGTTTATLNTGSAALVGVAIGDTVTLNSGGATGAFATKTAGTNKTVTVSGLTISGTDSGNYTLTQPTTTANITAASLTVSATGVNKVYDGNTNATVTLTDNRVAGDVLTTSYTSATFTDKNVSIGKTVNVSGISISGTDAANYSANTTTTTTANVTAASLTVSATGVNKVYDGTTTATVTLSDNRVAGDVLTTAYTTASFADSLVGTAKPVSVSGITVTGTDAGNYTFNTTTTTTANITRSPTTTTVSSSPNPSAFGQSVTFTATVTGTNGIPTGTVTFKDGATALGTNTLSAGQATLTTSSLAGGSHSITAVYNGDTTFTNSTSAALTQTVNKVNTTTTLASSQNPSVFGQAVITATVTGTNGTPTGTVTFMDGATTLGTNTLASGQATLTGTALSAGSHSITAVYNGDGNFNTSTSSALSQTVNKSDTTTAIISSANPSVSGQSVTFTATVNPVAPGAGTRTGTVQFAIDGVNFGTPVTLSGGSATSAGTNSLPLGSHTITAVYSGDSNFNGSTSPNLSQAVNKANSTTTISSSLNPSYAGQPVTFTNTVGASAPGTGTPTGTVQFTIDGSNLGVAVTASGGTATSVATASLSVSNHTVTAVYSGDANFNGGTSANFTQTVNPSPLTPATGGAAIPATTVGGAYTSLTGPVYQEPNSSGGDVGVGTIVLNIPSGFVFATNSPAPTVLMNGGANANKNINGLTNGATIAVTVTTTNLSITIASKSSGGSPCTLTWQNIRVRPTVGVPLASGNITKSGTSAMTGITDGVINFGTLTEVAGAIDHFVFATINSPQAPGTAFNITVTAQDQFNNTVTTFTNTVNLSTTAGTISPTVSGSFTNGQRTESVTLTGSGTNQTITATRTGGTETGTSSPFTLCAPPSITGQPAAQTVCAGGTASYTVTATGTALTYQWQKNGSNISNGGTISGTTSPTLTLTSVAAADSAATFDCVVSGTCSPAATSSAAALTVNIAPAITGQPAAQTVCAGGTASYTVTATGTALTYQWQKNGSNISNGGTISGATSATLSLTGVASGDSGATFDCVVSGTCSPAATSGAAALTVNTAPAITGQPAAQTVCAGGTASYTVTATGTALTYQWQKNGSNISNGGTISGATSPTLSLTGVAGGDSGATFDCVVGGTCGPAATSSAAALTVNTAPTITCPVDITTNNAAGTCGQIVTFAASATGSPAPIITYSQNSGTTFPVGTNTVNCTASNVCGTTNCTFNVIVNSTQPPVITCPADVFTNTDVGQCTVSNLVIGTATATDDCEVATLVSDAPGDFTFSTGTNQVVWTATDIHGNQSACTQLVIVVNIEPPTISGCPTNLTVSCATDVSAPDISSIVATDNCSAVTVSWLSDTISNQTCPNRYTVLRIYQATDASGNSTTCTQTITVDDETAPVITSSPADTTVSCAAAVPAADDTAVSATDNCGGPVTVTHDVDVISGQSCANRYTISRTYHVTDACGNSSGVTQTITVNDTTGPVLSGVPTDATASCDAVPAVVTVTATDDCDGSVTVSFDEVHADGNCPNNYTLTRTWTATDACGNTTSATQILTVHDSTGPVLSGQGADATIESPATPVFTAPTVTDNCDASPLVSFSDTTNQLCSSAYKVTRTWTATDACGNVSAPVSQSITVGDATPPTINCPADVFTNTDLGLCTVSNVVIGTATATNSSGGHITVINDAPTMFATGTNAVVWTATDGCGNSSSCTQQVIVVDNEPPTISGCPTNLTVGCAASVPVPDISSVTATDNCSAVTVNWLSDTITNQTCPNRYTVLRVYQATDASGNSATCTQTITVDDETVPVITSSPADTTVSCASAVPAADDTAVSANANCGGTVTVTHDADAISNQTCANRYTISRTYHATDACGNTSSVTQTIAVNDTTGPVLSGVPIAATASCDAVPAAATVTATDDCDGSVSVSVNEVRTDGTCPNNYTLTRTWTATDACGNTSSTSQTITVHDATAPVLSGQGADATIESPATPVFSAPTASDTCDTSPLISFSDATNQLCGASYRVTRTWTATDACGNVSAPVSQSVTVDDTTAPTISCPVDVFTNTDLGRCTVSNVVLGTATGSDNSGGHVTVINDAPGAFPTGTNAVVWTATDGCGNSSSCTQQVIVVDNEPPTISGCPTNLTVGCAASVPVPDISSVTATDNCSAVTVNWLSDTITNQTCPNRYTVLRAYQATDASGNSATCTQTIAVDTETIPVITASPANTTVSCAAAVPAADDTAVSATANCGGAVTVTHDADVISGQSCDNRYTISRTYHATDACGNSASVTQTITVNDTTGPVLSGVPADASAACDAVPSTATVTATDNCDGDAVVSFNESRIDGTCPNNYTLTRTWTATDACGNTSSATQTLRIHDSTAPSLSGPGADATIESPATPVFTAPTASDNCDASPLISFSDTTNQLCGASYRVTRTWTAMDACGNVSAPVSQSITVGDTTRPTISCPADVTTNTDVGVCTASGVVLGSPTTSDNSGGHVTVINDAPGTFSTGTNAVVWTATDGCGNSSSCTQQVIVVDNEPPMISGCPTNLTVGCASAVRTPDLSSVTATDNCSAVTVSWLSDTLTNQTCPNRYTVLRIYQATDASGNSATCTQTIIVDDETIPVITASPANTTVSCATAVPAADDTAVSATANCGGTVTVTHDADAISNQTCANRYTISRTYHATDACGNTSSVTQTIAVNDTTGPVLSGVPIAATASCDAVPAAATVTATDDCDGSVSVSVNEVRTDGTCPNNYTLTRTWTATDACGNTSSTSQTITVHDSTAPSLSGPGADATIESPATPVFTAPTASDNCDTSPLISSSDATNQLCGASYRVTRTWTATDACGNVSAPVSQSITVDDTTAPTISCPVDVFTNTDLGRCTVSNVVLGTATGSDNSGGHVTVINDAPGAFPTGTNAVVWTATDGCGNSSSCTQQVIVVDRESPTISGCPTNLTVGCASAVPAPDVSSVTVTDNCSAVNVSWLSDTITNQTCPNRYTVLRTYQATDASGNSNTCTQTITVDDETAPVITSSPANVTVSCASAVPAVDDTTVSATANCGGAVTVTHDADVISGQSCANRYTISRTYHATDACGNSASVTQTITVNDTTGPVLSGVPTAATASCDAVPAAATVSASDDCDGSVTASFSENRTDGTCPNSYTLTRTWTVTDACGNTSSTSQTITVADSSAPVIHCPADQQLACGASTAPAQTGTATATDNCDPNPTISHSDTPTAANCTGQAGIDRTWTAIDACGNSASCVQHIRFIDTTPPVISCPSDVTVSNDTGECYASGVVLGAPTASDNCADSGLVVNDAPTQFPIGTNQVVWTVTDDCGNSATCTQQVIVVDSRPAPWFRIVNIKMEGGNVRVTWTAAGGSTNVLQAASTLSGNSSNSFADISAPIVIVGCGEVTTNFVDVGGTSGTPARYYRVRLVP